MSENETPKVQEQAAAVDEKKPQATLVDAVFDIGLEWAAHGLRVAKSALETSGKTLSVAAKQLERLATELGAKNETNATR
jgi:hypothetical protein